MTEFWWYTAFVVIGFVVYLAQLPFLIDLRRKLGKGNGGLLVILIDGLLGALLLMTLLYGWILVRVVDVIPDSGTLRNVTLVGLSFLFVVKPVWILARMLRFRHREARDGESIGDTAARAVKDGHPDPWDGHTERRKTDPPAKGDTP